MVKKYFELKEKFAIAEEAYATNKDIRPTALKYGVQPNQVRTWAKLCGRFLQQRDNLPDEETVLLRHKTIHLGGSTSVEIPEKEW